MWRALAAVALSAKQLKIAHKCHEFLGNKSRALYLEKTMKIAEDYAAKFGDNCTKIRKFQTYKINLHSK
jgi:hypothetical protein